MWSIQREGGLACVAEYRGADEDSANDNKRRLDLKHKISVDLDARSKSKDGFDTTRLASRQEAVHAKCTFVVVWWDVYFTTSALRPREIAVCVIRKLGGNELGVCIWLLLR